MLVRILCQQLMGIYFCGRLHVRQSELYFMGQFQDSGYVLSPKLCLVLIIKLKFLILQHRQRLVLFPIHEDVQCDPLLFFQASFVAGLGANLLRTKKLKNTRSI